MTPCTHCGSPAMNMLCNRCLGLLQDALSTIARLAGELEVEITRQTAKGRGGPKVRTADTKPLPFNADASDVLTVARETMLPWAIEVPGRITDTRSVRALAVHLGSNIRRTARLRGVNLLLDEIGHVRDQMMRVVDLAPEVAYIGQCPNCSTAVHGDRTQDWIEHSCGEAVPVVALLGTTHRDIQESWVSATEIRRYLKGAVTSQDISRWYKAGKVRRHEDYYHVGDVIKQARAKAQRTRPKVISSRGSGTERN